MSRQFKESIANEEIRELEMGRFEGRIHLIDSYRELKAAVKKISKGDYLGFDTETRPTFKKGQVNKVSLLQLANKTDAWLFRLNMTGLTPELAEILSNPEIIKVGVALPQDLRTLNVLRDFQPAGFIDLQDWVKSFGIKDAGLRKLTGLVLGFRLSKTQQVTDWEAESLTEAQQIYAATDAWAAFEIYRVLSNGGIH